MPILLTYSALPNQNWWVHTVQWFSHTPVEVHHTECYSSVAHHAILKRVFSKYILNTWKEKRGNETKLLLIAAIRSQKNVEGCVLRLDGWIWNSAVSSVWYVHTLFCSLSPSAWLPCISSFRFSRSEQVSYMQQNSIRLWTCDVTWCNALAEGLMYSVDCGLMDSQILTCYRTQMFKWACVWHNFAVKKLPMGPLNWWLAQCLQLNLVVEQWTKLAMCVSHLF